MTGVRSMSSIIQAAIAVSVCMLLCLAGSVAYGQSGNTAGAVTAQMIENVEATRAPQPTDVDLLVQGTHSNSRSIQVLAVRALGRLERPAVIAEIVPSLGSSDADVRKEAANALAQALSGPGRNDVGPAVRALRERLASEADASVRGVIYASLGRLPYSAETEVREIETVLINGTAEGGKDPSSLARLGAATGLETLFRQQVKKGTPAQQSLARLQELVKTGGAGDTNARVRRLSMAALIAGGGADTATVKAALKDSDAQVRRLAAVAAGSNDALTRLSLTPAKDPIAREDRHDLITEALRDSEPMVRYDALQAYGVYLQKDSCQSILAAVKDTSPQVSLLALDLLGKECPEGEKEKVTEALSDLAKQLPAGLGSGKSQATWHKPTHAFVSLSSVAPDSATELLPKYVSNTRWEVRMYAARAAANLKDASTLEKLATDSDDNVRSGAITGLARLKGHADDAIYISELQRPDHNLIRVSARALTGAPDKSAAAAALMSTLDRLTQEKKDNTRDARVGIIQALKDLGGQGQADALRPYLNDFDPRVASLAADDLTAWTGSSVKAAPMRPPTQPANMEEVDKLAAARVRIVMARGGTIEVRMFPADAPATVERFVKLARAGYYNGLTFHRVVPNWVMQGGSPGANELAGDSPFMNDEVGLRPHVRGALGISTRGHDTGDAQIYVDLCDNFRLDHAYTVWGEVVSGMDVADRVIEADVISRIEISVPGGKTKSR